jgi:hypothetical protein
MTKAMTGRSSCYTSDFFVLQNYEKNSKKVKKQNKAVFQILLFLSENLKKQRDGNLHYPGCRNKLTSNGKTKKLIIPCFSIQTIQKRSTNIAVFYHESRMKYE